MEQFEAEVLGAGFLEHYGIKGMKWGVRKRDTSADGTVEVQTGITKSGRASVATKGGAGFEPHKDAVGAARTRQVLEKSGTHALSNKELQDLATRLNLERQVGQLTAAPPSKGQQFVAQLLGQTGKQQINRVVNQQATKAVDNAMANAGNSRAKKKAGAAAIDAAARAAMRPR